MRVVLDTSVMVAALRSNAGASRKLLVTALKGGVKVLISTPLLLEYEAVLSRPEHLAISGLTSAEMGVVLDALASVAQPIRLAFLWRPLLRDADDDMVLETAVNGSATHIATFNPRDFIGPSARFGVQITTPANIVRHLEAPS